MIREIGTTMIKIGIAIFCITISVNAQLVDRAKTIPFVFKKVKFSEHDNFREIEDVSSEPWIVYSDRDNNITYYQPSGNTVKKTLKFLEWFYVAEIYNNWVHLVKDPAMIKVIEFSIYAEDYGWIPMSNLLLWRNCLVTDNMINKKAMIINQIDTTLSPEELERDIIKFSSGPGPGDIIGFTGKEMRLFQFFFVYKKVGDYWLLGVNDDISDASYVKDTIWGWAHNNIITLWDTRIAVEPNWDPVAVEERKEGKKAIFLIDEPNAQRYIAGLPIADSRIIWNGDPLGERPIGEWRRFPLLNSESGSDIFDAGVMGHTIAFGSDFTGDEKIVVSKDELAELHHKLTKIIKNSGEVNIVFIIDGTWSMRDYWQNVVAGIQESEIYLKRESENRFRFGSVIYRDYSQTGKFDREIKPLALGQETAGWLKERTDNWLTNHRTLPDADVDLDFAEALYFGLEGALRGVGLTEDAVNVIILLGDAGNHLNDPQGMTIEKIIPAFVKYQCHILALQVSHPKDHHAYDDFTTQTTELAWQCADKNYKNYLGNETDQPPPQWSISPNGVSKIEDGVILAKIIDTENGNNLPPAQVKNLIIEFIKDIDIRQEQFRKTLDDIKSRDISIDLKNITVTGKSGDHMNLGPGVKLAFRKAGFSERDIQILLSKKIQFYTRGTAPMKINNQNHPLFKKVLLLTDEELYALKGSIVKIRQGISGSEEREGLYKAAKELFKSYLGEAFDPEQNTWEDLHLIVIGLPSKMEGFLKTVKIVDILDPRRFPDEQLRKYISIFNKSYSAIENIIYMRDSYQYKFETNRQEFYWIAEDILP